MQTLNPGVEVCSQTEGRSNPISSRNSLEADVSGLLLGLCSPGHSLLHSSLTPIQEKMSLHTSAPLPTPHSTPLLPGFTAQPQQPAFSTGSLFIPILPFTALPLSFFSLPLPSSPLQGADQFTVFLGGVRTPPPTYPHPSTHCHP